MGIVVRLLGRERGSVRVRPEHIRGQSDEFGGKGGQSVEVVGGIAVRKGDVLSLHIAEVAETLPKGRKAARPWVGCGSSTPTVGIFAAGCASAEAAPRAGSG